MDEKNTEIEKTEPNVVDVESKSIDEAKVDAALAYLTHEDTRIMSEIDEKKLLRKIDWMIVPMMWACYNLQYLDKTLINYAAVMGLYEDTNIDTDQFSQLALCFYVTYLFFELPTGYLMQRLPTGVYLGANVTLWGLMVTLNCVAKNFGGLVVLRVLLGCFEAAVAPALILITSMWYKKSEQPARVGFWYVGVGTGTIIGALTSFGFQHYSSSTFSSWQILFLLFGLITVAVGIIVMLFLPNNPMTSRLSHDEKIWAIERVRENQTGVENKHFKWHQAVECFKDPHTYLLGIITICSNIPNGAVSSYQATIIKGFGYTSKETALLSIPSGAIAIVCVISATWSAGYFNQRGLYIIILLIPGVIGGALMAFLPADNKAGKLIGNYMTNCIGASLPLLYSWTAANTAGHTKKVTMNAVLLMSFCLGNIIGPETFQKQDAPEFVPAKITIVVTVSIAIFFTVVLRVVYDWENKRRDRHALGLAHTENQEFLDLTDRENMEFRYQL